jgi:hypothetical protein
MIKYFAGGCISDIRPIESMRYKNILVSYFYYIKGGFRDYLMKNKYKYDSFFMDSGAFSFDNSGKNIDIDDYMKILKEDGIENYSVLDVIGNPQATLSNYNYMVKAGFNPVPCFHINTDIKYLYYYLENCEKLAIGGMVMSRNKESNLDEIFRLILLINPKIKVHGFGVSGLDICLKYPWHSVDSSSFLAIGKFARANKWTGSKFEVFDTFDLLENQFSMKIEDKSVGGLRDLLLFWQMEQYNQMIDYVNEKHKNKDFNHLTAQQKLF